MTTYPVSEPRLKKCPYCAEMIQEEAVICRHCGRALAESIPNTSGQKKGNPQLAVPSLVLGCISLLAWFYPICGFPISVTGLVLGIISANSSKRNLAIAGIVTSAIGLILSLINAALGVYLGVTGQLFQ